MREERTRPCGEWDFVMTSILRYAARVGARQRQRTGSNVAGEKARMAVIGTGKLASFLAPALAEAGYRITEVVTRNRAESMKRARALARRVGARAATLQTAALDASVLWLAVPDGEIRRVAESLAGRERAFGVRPIGVKTAKAGSSKTKSSGSSRTRCVFHSSGALGSRELDALRKAGFAVASVHPLMTFVAGARPSLVGVPFAVEGDSAAVRIARTLVRELGGQSFVLAAQRKAAYHTWATMTSPLLLAFLVALEGAARAAGLGGESARRMSLPILRQTLENYARLGPADSFSGPFVRGDEKTVEKHLALLKGKPKTRAVYVALARAALDELPVRNREKLRRLLDWRR